MRVRAGWLALGVAVGLAWPHLLDYLAPVSFGAAGWAYAVSPRARWLLERRA